MSNLLSTTNLGHSIQLEYEEFTVVIERNDIDANYPLEDIANNIEACLEYGIDGLGDMVEEIKVRDEEIKKLLGVMFFSIGIALRYMPEGNVSIEDSSGDNKTQKTSD